MKSVKIGFMALAVSINMSYAFSKINNSIIENTFIDKAPKMWQPLMEMREVMKSTFHPMLENNLKPARENAPLMLEKAIALVAATDRPKYLKGSKKTAELNDLLEKAEVYAHKVAQNASDDDVKIALSDLHAVFAGLVPEKTKKKLHKKEGQGHNK
jgi:hypothetical protein